MCVLPRNPPSWSVLGPSDPNLGSRGWRHETLRSVGERGRPDLPRRGESVPYGSTRNRDETPLAWSWTLVPSRPWSPHPDQGVPGACDLRHVPLKIHRSTRLISPSPPVISITLFTCSLTCPSQIGPFEGDPRPRPDWVVLDVLGTEGPLDRVGTDEWTSGERDPRVDGVPPFPPRTSDVHFTKVTNTHTRPPRRSPPHPGLEGTSVDLFPRPPTLRSGTGTYDCVTPADDDPSPRHPHDRLPDGAREGPDWGPESGAQDPRLNPHDEGGWWLGGRKRTLNEEKSLHPRVDLPWDG